MTKGCSNCKHWRGGVVCDAFPKGIPLPIQAGDIAHTKPLAGDNGIQWERAVDNGENGEGRGENGQQ